MTTGRQPRKALPMTEIDVSVVRASFAILRATLPDQKADEGTTGVPQIEATLAHLEQRHGSRAVAHAVHFVAFQTLRAINTIMPETADFKLSDYLDHHEQRHILELENRPGQ
ncbi:hypothetical protein PHK61_26695 [Actinomycetospora lutea]|uniref:hypothetical protein n=1 Tax=Actinomycetospora lutea TaxID=663604 RepID=UPI002365CB24|nr:hypothetical protein [Actinomycetospora lutea]MDD7942010.1 hypothetical protein [Actinomycetospora lutea]